MKSSAIVRTVALGLATVVLSGCLRANIGINLEDDESGTFTARMLIDAEKFEELAGAFGGEGEADDPCDEITSETDDLPPGATVTPVTDGSWCGADVSVPFDDLDGLAEVLTEFNESDDDDDAPFGQISVTKLADGYRFEATDVQLSDEAMGFGEGDDADEELAGLATMMKALLGDLRIQYDVTLPGKPTVHNADSVDGNTFHFDLRIGDERTELFAETGPGEASSGGGGSAVVWIIVIALVVLAAIAAFVLLRRKSSGAGKGPDAPGPDTPLGRSFDEVTATRSDPFDAPPAPATPTPATPPPPAPPAAPADETPGSSFDDIVRRQKPDWEPPSE